MKIYMFDLFELAEIIPDFNGFTASEWNDLSELPKEVLKLMKEAKEKDRVYTIFNFMTDFNINDPLTNSENYIMFIPDPKFNI